MTRLRFGVVGCGAVATLHQLPELRKSPRVELVAVVDTDGAWARRVADRFQIPQAYDDHAALIGRVDGALVATPNTTHCDIACALLERGIHVLCEKPMATSSAEVDRMFQAAGRGRARIMAGHCLRFSPNLQMLKEIISAGWLGSLINIDAAMGSSYDRSEHRTEFRRNPRLAGGGVLVDLGIHLIDLCVWLTGDAPVSVAYDGAAAEGWEAETDADLVLQFDPGPRTRLSASFSHSIGNSVVVRGDAGWASAALHDPTDLRVYNGSAHVCRRAGAQRVVLPNDSMYERQITHFCNALLGGLPFVVRSEEVRRGIAVIESCYSAAKTNAA